MKPRGISDQAEATQLATDNSRNEMTASTSVPSVVLGYMGVSGVVG